MLEQQYDYNNIIFKKVPKYIYVWLILIILLMVLFSVFCFCYKYNKFYEINGIVIGEGSDQYVQVLFEYDKLDFIENADLILNDNVQEFKYQIGPFFYSDNGVVFREVNIYFNHLFEAGEIVYLNFRTPKTTVVEQFKIQIKKGMK